jgi:hypothetical protein
VHRTSMKPCQTYAYGPIQPLFLFWWWGTSGDHPKKDFGLMATSYWKTLKKNRKYGWKTSLNASNLSKSGELFFEVLSNSVKFLRICKRIIFFKLFWVQFCTSSLGKKGCSPIFTSLFFLLVIYCANEKIKIQNKKQKTKNPQNQ